MQVILTWEEYSELVEKAERPIDPNKHVISTDLFQRLCTQIANWVPNDPAAINGHLDNYHNAMMRNPPVGCIMTKTATNCNNCPTKDICPNDSKRINRRND